MKTILFLICSFCFFTPIQAQISTNLKPQEYNIGNRKIAFEDNFDNDNNKWLEFDDDSNDTAFVSSKETKITNGVLRYDNLSKSKIFAAGIQSKIDFNKNFEIELSASISHAVNRKDDCGIIFWGRDATYNSMYLYYNQDQFMSLMDCLTSNHCKSKSKRSKDFIKDDFNKITIRHYNDSYYIFINEKFQKAFPFRSLAGNKIGLGAGIQCTMAYDYIKIYYLD